MKPKMITVLGLIAILALSFLGVPGSMAAPPPPSYRSVVVTEGAPPKAVLLGEKDVLQIRLAGNPSTGYGWQLETTANFKVVGDTYTAALKPGDAVTQILDIVPTSAGKAALKLAYMPPQRNEPAARHFEVTVEAKSAFKGTYIPAPDAKAPVEAQTTAPGLAASFNYCTNIGGCTPIKNQGSCGSCWAFATIGVAEQIVKAGGGGSLDMSEQYLVNCSPWNCSGGYDAFDYLISTAGKASNQPGWRSEAQVPYTGQNGTCTTSTPQGRLQRKGSPGTGTTNLKNGIQTYGPLWVTVVAGSRMQAYTGGIFSTGDSGTPNHAVIIYGWEDTGSYWYMRNSWGTGWGESGTMRITFGTSQIGGSPVYATYQGTNPTPTPTQVGPTPTRTPTGVGPTPTRTPTTPVNPTPTRTPTPGGVCYYYQYYTYFPAGTCAYYGGYYYTSLVSHYSYPYTYDIPPYAPYYWQRR